jgi:hypothetical protein
MVLESWSVDDLSRRCAEETSKYRLRQTTDPQYCFELLKRALLHGMSDAMTRVYQIYERLVTSWVYHHSRFSATEESADYFVSSAFSSFYFALRGPTFRQFSSVASVLAYLKLCVHTAIAQYLRNQEAAPTEPLTEGAEPGYTPDLASDLYADELWSHICRLLPEKQDQLLAHCAFVQHLKPAQILDAFAGYWPDARAVSVSLQRLRRVLRKDSVLRQWAGVDEASSSQDLDSLEARTE